MDRDATRRWLVDRLDSALRNRASPFLRRVGLRCARLKDGELRAVLDGRSFEHGRLPVMLRGVLCGLLERAPGSAPVSFAAVVEAILSLDAQDLLEQTAREPRYARKLSKRLQQLMPRLSPTHQLLLARQVNPDLAARGREAKPTVPAPPLAALGAGTEQTAADGISIVVALHGRPFQALRLLASIGLLRARLPLEVLLSLDPATDAEDSVLRNALGGAAELRVLRSAAPLPVGQARNRLIEAAKFDRIVSLDSDMVLLRPADALCPLADSFPKNRFWNLGYLGVRDLLSLKLVKYAQAQRADGGGLALLRNRSLLRLGAKDLEGATEAVVPGNRLSGGASMFSRDRFLSAGGYSDEFDIGWEDVELSLRLAADGQLVLNALAAPLFHGHIMPFNAKDLSVEHHRFDSRRYEAGLAVLARHGVIPDRAVEIRHKGGSEDELRCCPFKAAALQDAGARVLNGFDGKPLVGWAVSALEMCDGPVALGDAGWSNVVLGAPEVATLPRLAASFCGVSAVVIGPEAAAFLADRVEPFDAQFGMLNAAFASPILLPGDGGLVARALAEIFPRAPIRAVSARDLRQAVAETISARQSPR